MIGHDHQQVHVAVLMSRARRVRAEQVYLLPDEATRPAAARFHPANGGRFLSYSNYNILARIETNVDDTCVRLSPPLFRPVENLVENDRLPERVGLVTSSSNPVANVSGIAATAASSLFGRLVRTARRRRRFADTVSKPAQTVVEHLMQMLVDLLIGLGNLLAQRLLAAAETLARRDTSRRARPPVRLPATSATTSARTGCGQRRTTAAARSVEPVAAGRRDLAARRKNSSISSATSRRNRTRAGGAAGRRANLPQTRQQLTEHRHQEDHEDHHDLEQVGDAGGQ